MKHYCFVFVPPFTGSSCFKSRSIRWSSELATIRDGWWTSTCFPSAILAEKYGVCFMSPVHLPASLRNKLLRGTPYCLLAGGHTFAVLEDISITPLISFKRFLSLLRSSCSLLRLFWASARRMCSFTSIVTCLPLHDLQIWLGKSSSFVTPMHRRSCMQLSHA